MLVPFIDVLQSLKGPDFPVRFSESKVLRKSGYNPIAINSDRERFLYIKGNWVF